MVDFKNLAELRKSKGITQKFICEQLGISRPTLNRKEKRLSIVSVSEANMFAKLYDTDIEVIEKLCRS